MREFRNLRIGTKQEGHESLWVLYERYLLKGSNLRDYVVEGRKADVKGRLINELVNLDRMTAKERVGRARAVTDEIIKALDLMKANVLVVEAELTYKGLFGSSQGLGSVALEVGLTWDTVLDLPVIPGSSFKGAVRSFCIESLVGSGLGLEDAEKQCSALLGCAGENGRVAIASFLDAFPIKVGRRGGLIEEDVLNPHYNALMNEELRTELDVTPVPVLHLCVSEGTVFRFIAYVPHRVRELTRTGVRAVDELADELKIPRVGDASVRALLTVAHLVGGALKLGLGARTLKGYGRFKILSHKVRIHA